MLRISVFLVGLGIVLMVVSGVNWWNPVQLVSNSMIATGILLFLLHIREAGREVNTGNKVVFFLLLFVVASSIIGAIGSGISEIGVNSFYVLYMGFMFLLFLFVRHIGWRAFILVIPFSLMQSGVCIYEGFYGEHIFAYAGDRACGLTTNPNIVASFLTVSIFFYRGKWKLLLPIPLLAIYFTGYWVAWFAIVVVGLFVIYEKVKEARKEHRLLQRRNFLLFAVTSLCIILALVFGVSPSSLYGSGARADVSEKIHNGFGSRYEIYCEASSDIGFLGNGVQRVGMFSNSVSDYSSLRLGTVIHNTPIAISYEFGILAGVAWVLLVSYMMVRASGRARYALVAFVCLSMAGISEWGINGMVPIHFALIGLVSYDIDSAKEIL